ncbi:hypothetical protein WA171_004007 [Blastocystis sp. BT1]
MNRNLRVNSFSRDQFEVIVELLKRIYTEEINLKGRIKILEQHILFSKVVDSISPIPDEDDDSTMRTKMHSSELLEISSAKNDLPRDTVAQVIHDHSSLQVAVRRLNQLLDEMRDVRDEFVNTYSLLQKRLDELETITTQFYENLLSSSSRSRASSFVHTLPVTKQEQSIVEKQQRDNMM